MRLWTNTVLFVSKIKSKAQRLIKDLSLVALMCLTSCATVDMTAKAPVSLNDDFEVPKSNILLATPASINQDRDQIILVKLSQMLDTQAKSADERAELFYELGIVYDRLGLESTARSMFMNALVENNKFGPAYNFVGIYFAEDGRFQDACDAFDASLELNPKDAYVYFNRGIVLYYADRSKVGLDDLEKFYNDDHNDPYRQLWYYILEQDVYGTDYARSKLAERYAKVSQKDKEETWGFNLVKLYLGSLSEAKFFDGTKQFSTDAELYSEHLCEGYFYLAKLKEMAGNDKLAYDYYHLAVASRRYGFLEYRYALQEIKALEKKHGIRESIYTKEQLSEL